MARGERESGDTSGGRVDHAAARAIDECGAREWKDEADKEHSGYRVGQREERDGGRERDGTENGDAGERGGGERGSSRGGRRGGGMGKNEGRRVVCQAMEAAGSRSLGGWAVTIGKGPGELVAWPELVT